MPAGAGLGEAFRRRQAEAAALAAEGEKDPDPYVLPDEYTDPAPNEETDPNSLLGRAAGAFAEPFDFSGLPEVPGPDGFAEMGNELADASYQRGMHHLEPMYQRREDDLTAALANQGIPIGSEAYNDAHDRFGRERNEAFENLALRSVGAGRNEQSRLTNLAMALRNMRRGEHTQLRDRPLHELSQMLAQVINPGMPTFPQTATYGMNAPNVMDMYQNNYNQQYQDYRDNRSDVFGALGTLGGGYLGG